MHTNPALRSIALAYKALGNERRLFILSILSRRAFVQGELAESVGIHPSSLTRHLQLLSRSGFIEGRRRKREVVFSLSQKFTLTWILDYKRLFAKRQRIVSTNSRL